MHIVLLFFASVGLVASVIVLSLVFALVSDWLNDLRRYRRDVKALAAWQKAEIARLAGTARPRAQC